MKTFRNTGIEGGYGNLGRQNYLLGLRRSITRASRVTGERPPHKHRQLKGLGPPVKTLSQPFPKGTTFATRYKAVLLQYAQATQPVMFGSWACNSTLVKAELIEMVVPPAFMAKKDTKTQYGIGALYQITDKGRAYVAELRAPGQ